MSGKSLEIVCTACGADTLVKRVPKFEGFKKTGEAFACISCGHEYPGEEDVPFKARRTLSIFGDEDRLKKIEVFAEDEKGRNCRYCCHYVVNPFTQRCGLSNSIVQATDTCEKFEKEEESGEQKEDQGEASSLDAIR